MPQQKRFLHEVETNVAQSVVLDYTDGEKELTEFTGKTFSFPNPKPTTLISRFVLQTTDEGEWVLDFFAGSGTTAHAAANAHRVDDKRRKVLLIDQGEYFETTLLPRIKRVYAAKHWRRGKPTQLDGIGLFAKVCAIEQYEEAIATAIYQEETGDLFRNTKTDPYSQYIFFRDMKMARALELDYEKDEVNVHVDRLYPDIDLAETLSCITGKWIKRVTAEEVEFADGSKQSLDQTRLAAAQAADLLGADRLVRDAPPITRKSGREGQLRHLAGKLEYVRPGAVLTRQAALGLPAERAPTRARRASRNTTRNSPTISPGETATAEQQSRKRRLAEWYEDGMMLTPKERASLNLSLRKAKLALREMVTSSSRWMRPSRCWTSPSYATGWASGWPPAAARQSFSSSCWKCCTCSCAGRKSPRAMC